MQLKIMTIAILINSFYFQNFGIGIEYPNEDENDTELTYFTEYCNLDAYYQCKVLNLPSAYTLTAIGDRNKVNSVSPLPRLRV